ncbi:MAG TPA: substrate-binding domain-containing protein [Solirubrobacteraceae bacterium]|nr:substrate-binding domain-containing protein [Solirubrobacteraceae bacterium]
MTRITRITVAALTVSLVAAAAPAVASARTRTVTISGATASYPLVSLLAQRYVKLHPKKDKIRFKITQGGTTVGISDVASGRVTMADVSREPISSDFGKGLVFYPIARYAICVITNSSNPVASLTQSQLTGVFTGTIKTWSELASDGVSGITATGPISVVTRTSVAGVLTSFKTLLLEGKSVEKSATEEATEGLEKQAVKGNPAAIGFVSNYQVELGGVHAAKIGSVTCDKAEAISGAYPGVARFYEVTHHDATGAARWFISWIEHSRAAAKIIDSRWITA